MNQNTTSYSGGLSQLVKELKESASNKNTININDILHIVGTRSYGPIILLVGLIMLVPGLSDIPTVSVILGMFLILTVGQILLQFDHIWLPQWLLNRSVSTKTFIKTLDWTEKPVAVVERVTSHRLPGLVDNQISSYFIGLATLVIALGTPLMEVIPFSANIAGLSIFLFGVALFTHDGIVMIAGVLVFIATSGLIGFSLF